MVGHISPHLKKLAGAEPQEYFGDRATEAVIKAVRGPRFVLLGTHGLFAEPGKIRPGHGYLKENPLLRCSLIFAGCDRKPAAGDTSEDGWLMGVEVLGCDFRGTELVVLSACQTAQGDVHAGQAAVGMRSAFLLAGAQRRDRHTLVGRCPRARSSSPKGYSSAWPTAGRPPTPWLKVSGPYASVGCRNAARPTRSTGPLHPDWCRPMMDSGDRESDPVL